MPGYGLRKTGALVLSSGSKNRVEKYHGVLQPGYFIQVFVSTLYYPVTVIHESPFIPVICGDVMTLVQLETSHE